MDKDLALRIKEIIETEFGYEVEIMENYSGKGMFGRATCAVVIDNPMTVGIAIGILMEREEDVYVEPDELRVDNLGLQYVVY